jgi:hypothetical protein
VLTPLVTFLEAYPIIKGGPQPKKETQQIFVEAPSGLEPLNRGFADLSLSHLGTAPYKTTERHLIVFDIVR